MSLSINEGEGMKKSEKSHYQFIWLIYNDERILESLIRTFIPLLDPSLEE